jgi:hypothetical protein
VDEPKGTGFSVNVFGIDLPFPGVEIDDDGVALTVCAHAVDAAGLKLPHVHARIYALGDRERACVATLALMLCMTDPGHGATFPDVVKRNAMDIVVVTCPDKGRKAMVDLATAITDLRRAPGDEGMQ